MVKRLRRCPLKAKSWVRFPLEVPPRDSDIDTISGSFLLRFFGDVMQNSRDYPQELVFREGNLQDSFSLNQVLKSRPEGQQIE